MYTTYTGRLPRRPDFVFTERAVLKLGFCGGMRSYFPLHGFEVEV